MIRPIPPVLFLLSIFGMVLLDRYVPIRAIGLGRWAWLSWVFVALGLVLPIWGIVTFRFHRTRIHPGEGHASTVVTTGPYRFTRNPMYLGMILILIGGALRLGSVSPWFMLPIFGLAITRLWIRREEGWMSEAFGDTYEHYRSKVRRWI